MTGFEGYPLKNADSAHCRIQALLHSWSASMLEKQNSKETESQKLVPDQTMSHYVLGHITE